MTSDRIEKEVMLKAPQARVWKALTDKAQFETWFRVTLEGPFVAGKTTHGQIAIEGYEHMKVVFAVERMQPESALSFRWHPYPSDPKVDYSKETPTLVEFRLEAVGSSTRVTVVESGFDKVPAHRRAEAFRMNEGGWVDQLESLDTYVSR